MDSATKCAKKRAAVTKRVVLVEDDGELVELLRDLLGRQFRCSVTAVPSLAEARSLIERKSVDLLVTDLGLPDGDGLTLLPLLRKRCPSAAAVVISGSPAMDTVVDAIRAGAVDYVPKPFSADQLSERVAAALTQQDERVRSRRKLRSLRKSVVKLNEARKMVSKKVDLLCNDLISAYGDLAKQFGTVRVQESYRQIVAQSPDLEQLLCHTMDWLLRELGYSNIGVWLSTDQGEFQLGAYMKYTVPGEPGLTDALQRNLVRMAARKGLIRLKGDEARQALTPAELKYVAGQDVLAINCTYLGETLGVIAMFRDERTGFTDDDVEALQSVASIFPVALSRLVKDPSESDDTDPDAAPNTPPREDPNEWWKRGEEPPF